MQKLWLEGRGLLRDRNFLILLFGFSVGLGVFNALLTLIAQLVQPCGYDSSDAGLFGGVLIGAGLLGAAIAGPVRRGARVSACACVCLRVLVCAGVCLCCVFVS